MASSHNATSQDTMGRPPRLNAFTWEALGDTHTHTERHVDTQRRTETDRETHRTEMGEVGEMEEEGEACKECAYEDVVSVVAGTLCL